MLINATDYRSQLSYNEYMIELIISVELMFKVNTRNVIEMHL